MSSLENELKLLQEKEWTEDEKKMVDSFIENLKYYRKLIPTGLKKDRYREYFKNNNINIEKLKPTTETATATATTATATTETIIETTATATETATAITETTATAITETTATAITEIDLGVVSMCE